MSDGLDLDAMRRERENAARDVLARHGFIHADPVPSSLIAALDHDELMELLSHVAWAFDERDAVLARLEVAWRRRDKAHQEAEKTWDVRNTARNAVLAAKSPRARHRAAQTGIDAERTYEMAERRVERLNRHIHNLMNRVDELHREKQDREGSAA